ncbi:MAG: AsmA family protein [Chitinophagaceae bacterium]|nr:AsmA family protein [Chitinophagaceae bacterium]
MKNKYLKYTLKGLVVLLSILVILYTFVFIYVSVNKKKIIKQVTEEIGKKLNGNVTIGDVELSFFRQFPTVSVALHNVQITDTMYAQHHHAFFTGEEVFVNVGVISMIRKRSFINGFRIDKGSFYLYTDTAGYTNKYLFNPKKDAAAGTENSKARNELKKILLNNVRITEDDKQKNRLHDIIVNKLKLDLEDKDDATFLFSVEADMLVNSLAFNLERGSFIKGKTFSGKFDLRYDKNIKQLQFDSVNIKLDDQPFNITARFDMAGDNRLFSMRAYTNNILYSFARTLVTQKISTALSITDVDKPLDVIASLSGPLKGGDPLITVNFTTQKTHLKTPFIDFDNASFKGFYTNEVVAGLPRKDPNSKIVITDFSASWQDLPVTSDKIEIINLMVPMLTCDLQSSFSLPAFNDVIGSNSIQLKSGTGTANITYKGPLAKNNNTNSFVNGFVSFKNGTVLYKPRDVELKNVNGRVVFKSSDVFVENLQCEVLNNKVIMEGKALNLLTLIDAEPNKVNIDWNIYSPSLNLNAFTFLLKERKKVVAETNAKRKLVKMAGKIDQVLDQGSLIVNLKAGRLTYKKFEATSALANISLLQDRYVINNVSMEHAGGRMELSGSLVTQSTNTHHAKINVSLNNVDVSKTLEAFNNFGQDGITAQSIAGKLTAKIDASLNVSDEGLADPASIESIVDFSLKDGALNNYEPVKKLQNFLFKNRDFENIRFAELKDRFEIKNGEVKINRMEIQSSVMSMFVEGIYSKKGTTDISIQVPLSNIHKRGADFNPENIGTDKKPGSSIHLRGRPGPDGNIKFKLDLFNKFKRDKGKTGE